MTALVAELAALIASRGPIPVATFMAAALGHPEHGYYRTRDPLGAAGDFTTAPEISQMFGEMLGVWIATLWRDQGAPAAFVLAELGPGRGTLLADLLRVARAVPGFSDAATVALIETSPVLRAAQARLIPGALWVKDVADLPEGPLFVVANEFFDALPVRQFRRADPGWQQRLVGLAQGSLVWCYGPVRPDPGLDARFPLTPDGVIVEVNPAGEAIAARLGARIAGGGGAALIVDYGAWDGAGDTLQAVRGHAPVDVLDAPGSADLSAHVRFGALARAAAPARVHGPVPQGAFLARLGIGARAARLAAGGAAEAVAAQLHRLTDSSEMGTLFQAMALTPPDAPQPPGFGQDDP